MDLELSAYNVRTSGAHNNGSRWEWLFHSNRELLDMARSCGSHGASYYGTPSVVLPTTKKTLSWQLSFLATWSHCWRRASALSRCSFGKHGTSITAARPIDQTLLISTNWSANRLRIACYPHDLKDNWETDNYGRDGNARLQGSNGGKRDSRDRCCPILWEMM